MYKTKIVYFYYVSIEINVFFFKYLIIYPLSMYNYHATTIFLLWILHIQKLCQNFWKLNFQFPSQVYFIKLCILQQVVFIEWFFFSKVLNVHLYILTKRKPNDNFLKSLTHHMTHHVILTWIIICSMTFLVTHHVWVMHINLCKK